MIYNRTRLTLAWPFETAHELTGQGLFTTFLRLRLTAGRAVAAAALIVPAFATAF